MQFAYFKVNNVYSIGLHPTMLALHQIHQQTAWENVQQYNDKPFGSRAEKSHTGKSVTAVKKFHSILFGKYNGKRREPNETCVVLSQIKYSS